MSVVLVLLLVSAVYAQDRPAIVGDIRNQTVKEFKDGILNCNYKSKMAAVVQWIKIDSKKPVLISGGETLQASSEKYKVGLTTSDDLSISSLTVRNASRNDAGRYRCIVRVQVLPYTQWPQKDGFLFVQVMPKIRDVNRLFSGLEQQNGHVQCTIDDLSASESTVQWIKFDLKNPVLISLGNSIDKKSKYSVRLDTNGTVSTSLLTIKSLTTEDAGKYKCIVQTRGVRYTEWPHHDVNLTVHAWPRIQSRILNQTIEEGSLGRFNCNVTDLTHFSQVRWARVIRGKPIMISEDEKMRVMTERYTVKLTKNGNWSVSSLTISSVTKEDSGWLRCMVTTQSIPYTQWPREEGYLEVHANHGSFGSGRSTGNRNNGGRSALNVLTFSTVILNTLFILYIK